MSPNHPLIAALRPITSRVRTDITARKNGAGVQAWTRQPLTDDALAAHLNGGPARGVCPIRAGESVTMLAVLDFDSHKGETGWPAMSMVVATVVDVLVTAWGAEPILFRSSGGRGVHLYLLWDEPQDAYSVRQWLAGVLEACGLRPGTRSVAAGQVEVFPKQDHVPLSGKGNQFILPLAGQSELLLLDDLSGLLEPVPGGKEAVLEWAWRTSPPVPLSTRPERTPIDAAALEGLQGEWRQALDAIPNGRDGAETLDYDQWRNVIFAIHHETQGSDAGLALAEEFSERALGTTVAVDLEFLRNRVWPYAHSDRGGAVITGGTIKSIAARYGWRRPIDDSGFEAVQDDDPAADDDESGEDDEDEHAAEGATGMPGAAGAAAKPAADAPARVVRRVVPPAEYRTTDQANAVRLVLAYGKRALAAADRWYVDDGKCWLVDDAGVCRYTCMLSKIVGDEARRCEIEEASTKESDDV